MVKAQVKGNKEVQSSKNISNIGLMAQMIMNSQLMQRKAQEQESIFGNAIKITQYNKTVEQDKIPVQTAGNCGLFAILTALRAFGFDDSDQGKAITAFDNFTKTDDNTLQGEIFSVDLMLSVINSLKIETKQILEAEKKAFVDQNKLEELLNTYKDDDSVTLLIAYSKPDEYDDYYAVLGEEGGDITNQNVIDAKKEKDKFDESKAFKAQHAHWGMINKIDSKDSINISDSLAEYGNTGHGYDTNMNSELLFKSNKVLDEGKFDWESYLKKDELLKEDELKEVVYSDMSDNEVEVDKTSAFDKKGLKLGVDKNTQEQMDLSGRIVVVKLTDYGKTRIK